MSPCRFHNAEGGFDVVDKFKSDQKEAFGEAAPIIHDLVMDVVRTTGGEIPYAMYVISEHGYVEYIGGELESKIDDIKSTVQFAKEHPLQAGGMAVIAIAANGKRIGAKGTKKRYGIFKKPNPSKGKPDINVVPPNSPAGGRVATVQPELPQPNKGKDAKSSKKELQSATVSDPAKVGSSGNSKNSPNSNNNSSGSNSSNNNSTNSNDAKNHLDDEPLVPDKNWKSTNTGQTDTNAKKLRKNLGELKKGEEAHHIVLSTHKRAAPTRDMLDEFQIDINDSANGVPLTKEIHQRTRLHSEAGIDMVHARLENAIKREKTWASKRRAIIEELSRIYKDVQNVTLLPKK